MENVPILLGSWTVPVLQPQLSQNYHFLNNTHCTWISLPLSNGVSKLVSRKSKLCHYQMTWLDIYYCQTVSGFWCGSPSLMRGQVCSLQLLYNKTALVWLCGMDHRGKSSQVLLMLWMWLLQRSPGGSSSGNDWLHSHLPRSPCPAMALCHNIVLHLHLGLMWSSYFIKTHFFSTNLFLPMHATCLAHLILLHLIT